MWFKRGCETRRREEEGAVIVGEQARTHTQLPQDPFWKEERENVKSLDWNGAAPNRKPLFGGNDGVISLPIEEKRLETNGSIARNQYSLVHHSPGHQ